MMVDDAILVIVPAGLAMVFLFARMTVHSTVVYRRNNLAAGLAFILFSGAVYLMGWWGFFAFTAGTLMGAWQWAASIHRANEYVARKQRPAFQSRRSRSVISAH
jgi:hypothetical protein